VKTREEIFVKVLSGCRPNWRQGRIDKILKVIRFQIGTQKFLKDLSTLRASAFFHKLAYISVYNK